LFANVCLLRAAFGEEYGSTPWLVNINRIPLLDRITSRKYNHYIYLRTVENKKMHSKLATAALLESCPVLTAKKKKK
jgi:hypothetical protein